MSVLDQLASSQDRRDEQPNQALAKHLHKTRDRVNIQELVDHLHDKDKAIQSDCIKVLYEIGYLDPLLIAEHWKVFLDLLQNKNNRLKWGGMIALATIAQLRAEELFLQRRLIAAALQTGSVILQDNAVKVLSVIASVKDEYRLEILPILLQHLEKCRAKDVPQHAESALMAINTGYLSQFVALLESRMQEMTDSQAKRLRKLINGLINDGRLGTDIKPR